MIMHVWFKTLILLTTALHAVSWAAVVVSNADLKAMVQKLQMEVSDIKQSRVQPMGYCSPLKCKRCQCVENLSLPEKYYCDCRKHTPRRDCKAFWMAGYYTRGIYTVNMNGLRKTDVFCDGSGWTVIQRRMDGSVDFFRSWDDYKKGFGKLQGEFWMGNENLYALSTQALYPKGSELIISMKSRSSWDLTYIAFYQHFQIDSEAANYKLHVKYSHGIGDSLKYHDGMEFSTFDKDNDHHKTRNCARELRGAWWYRACSESNLNGAYDPYEQLKPEQRVDWESLLYYRSQAWVEMKVMRLG